MQQEKRSAGRLDGTLADSAAWWRFGSLTLDGIKNLAVNPPAPCSGVLVAWIFDEGQEGSTEPRDRVQLDMVGEVSVIVVVPGFAECADVEQSLVPEALALLL
jgi:hypothetical protein